MTEYSPTIYPWNQEIWQSLTLEPERSNHALLMVGNSGLGKRALAAALAHFVLTENHAQSASLFQAGSHPDLHVLMPECEVQEDLMGAYAQRYLEQHTGKPKRFITIEQIRRLGAALSTHPHISSHRVVLMWYAEAMNHNAANALLKNLEEPPANTLFLLVTDEVSRLAKTIRSRCSLVNFRSPDFVSAKAWLMQQNAMPEFEADNHLAMANNHPLKALELFENNYIDALKAVFTDVNGLWSQKSEALSVAKHWQEIGSHTAVEILQKLSTDLLRCSLTETPAEVFFPVQLSWVQSSSRKLSRDRLLDFIEELNYAKRMLATAVDELLVLETVSIKAQALPA